MKQNNESLIAEINELRNEVKMLRAIVQSLMYVITEEQELDNEIEIGVDEKDSYLGRPSVRNYVS